MRSKHVGRRRARPAQPRRDHVPVANRGSSARFLRSKAVPFHLRINHGMTHGIGISDPDGHGIEVLYELPHEYWEDIDAAQNYSERLPTEGDESLVDTTSNPVFSKSG